MTDVARVRNKEYFKQLDFMRNALGINLIVNPPNTQLLAKYREYFVFCRNQTETFAKGRIELIEFNISSDNALCGKAILRYTKSLR